MNHQSFSVGFKAQMPITKSHKCLASLVEPHEPHVFGDSSINRVNPCNKCLAAVSNCERYGYGVWSWHDNQDDAEFNANLLGLGAKAVPVDYHDGELIVPYLAQAVVKKEGFV